jgi:AcrR family transcriptional regulator
VKSALDKVRESPGSTKARILASAQDVFAAKGFEGASTREIAARAEVNISSLHYHWESKETLYLAIFERIFQQLVDLLRDQVATPQSDEDARAVIERAMGLVFDFFVDHPTIPKLLMRRMMETEPVEQSAMRDSVGPALKVFSDWTRSFAPDRLPDKDVSFFLLVVQSVLFMSMLESPFVESLLGGNVHDTAVRTRVRRQLIQLVATLLGIDRSPSGKGGGGS